MNAKTIDLGRSRLRQNRGGEEGADMTREDAGVMVKGKTANGGGIPKGRTWKDSEKNHIGRRDARTNAKEGRHTHLGHR